MHLCVCVSTNLNKWTKHGQATLGSLGHWSHWLQARNGHGLKFSCLPSNVCVKNLVQVKSPAHPECMTEAPLHVAFACFYAWSMTWSKELSKAQYIQIHTNTITLWLRPGCNRKNINQAQKKKQSEHHGPERNSDGFEHNLQAKTVCGSITCGYLLVTSESGVRFSSNYKSLRVIMIGCEIVLGFFFFSRFGNFFGFLGWYHLPSVCKGLELEFVILHGICHIWACSPSILHGIYYMWACSPSILYGICNILACSPSILHGISYMWAYSPSILYGICHILACSPFHFAWDVLHVSMFTQIFTDAEAWD